MWIRASVNSVVGQSSTTAWGQTVSLPHTHVVLEVRAADDVARATGMRILSQLTQKLTEPPLSLEEVERIVDYAKTEGATSVVMLVSVGTVIYVASRGGGAVYLKRDDKLAELLSKDGAISGEVQIGDTLLLLSNGFTHIIQSSQLVHIFDHLSSEEVAEKFTLLLHQKTDGVCGAALVYQVKEFCESDLTEKGTEEVPKPYTRTFTFPFTRRHIIRGITLLREGHFPVTKIWKKILHRVNGQKRLLGLGVAGLFIMLFMISIVFGIQKQRVGTVITHTLSAIEEAQHALDEGVALRDLNPMKSRERLTQAKQLLEPLLAQVSPKSKEGKQLADIYKQITDNLTIAMQIHDTTPVMLFDPGLLKPNSRISEFSYSGNTLGAVDTATKTVYTVDLSTKLGTIAGGGDYITGNTHISLNPQHIYVQTDKEVFEIIKDGKGTKKSIIKNDDGWGTVVSMISYGGNIYMLDNMKGRIWKYVATEKGFSERREYLNPDTLPDLSAAVNLAVDGSVWVTTTKGTILKFTQGKEETFAPAGVEPALGAAVRVYTSDECTYLYVLDSAGKRIVVLDKEGNYVAQYTWKTELVPSSLAVSETLKKIYLLSGGSIWSFDLK